MSILWFIIKWVLIAIGAFSAFYMVQFQVKYDGFTAKFFNEYMHPQLHPKSLKTYMHMANILLDTKDITMASIRKVRVEDDVSNKDVEEAMSSVATEMGIKEVGTLPLSEQVELQLDKKQRFLKIYQYCSPTTAMIMIDHSDAFSAYLPCRIALIEDKKGVRWLYTLDMDFMIYGGKPLSPELNKLALNVRKIIYTIQDRAAIGDF